MDYKTFSELLKNANTVQELMNLRQNASTCYVSQIKSKIFEIAENLGWERYRLSTSTLKSLVGYSNSGCNSLTKIKVKNSYVLKKYMDKEIEIYVQDKLNRGNNSIIFVKQV